MTKEQFLKKLKSKKLTKDEKLEVLQFFVDNYVTLVKETIQTGFGFMQTGRRIHSKIYGLIINGGTDYEVNLAFEQLSKKTKEFKEYEK